MMKLIDKLLPKVAKYAKMIGMILMFAAAAFLFIVTAAGIGDAFMPAIGNIVMMIVSLALWGVVPLLILLKKYDLAQKALLPVFIFWILSSIFTFFEDCQYMVDGVHGLAIAAAVFEFIIGGALIAIIVLSILSYLKKERAYLQLAFLVMVCSLLFFFLAWIMWIAAYATFDLGWASYLQLFAQMLFLPIGMACLCLDYLMQTADIPDESGEAMDVIEPDCEEDVVSVVEVDSANKDSGYDADYAFADKDAETDVSDNN
jgi:hypothetical protein